MQLAAARLRYFARLANHAPPSLVALLQSDLADEWKAETMEALRFMQRTLSPKLAEQQSMRDWQDFVVRHPSAFVSAIREFEQQAPKAEPPLFNEAAQCAASVFSCSDCAREFTTHKALAAHRARKHHVRRASFFVANGSQCPVCKGDFRTRTRLMHHLEWGKASCVRALREGLVPEFSLAELVDARDADRRTVGLARRQGQWTTAGPPALPPPGGWRRPRAPAEPR